MPEVPGSTNVTHVAFLLDASGSMGSIRDEAIELFNGQVSAVRAATDHGRSTVSFGTFGTDSRPIIHYVGEPIERLEPLTHETYRPHGMTPMHDAIGWLVDRVEGEVVKPEEDYSVLVVIVSDGIENHSGQWQASVPAEARHRPYSAEEIQSMVTRLEATGRWTFTFLGANVDLHRLSERLGFKRGNMQEFVSSREGTKQARERLRTSSERYMLMKKLGVNRTDAFYVADALESMMEGNPAQDLDALTGMLGSVSRAWSSRPDQADAGRQEYPLEMIDGHLVITAKGRRLLLDTGSPASFGGGDVELCGVAHHLRERLAAGPLSVSMAQIAIYVGAQIDALIGLDILGGLAMRIDARGGVVTLSGEPIEATNGMRVPIIDGLAPMIDVTVEGRRLRLIWDTGARYSYLGDEQLFAGRPAAGRVQDFHPMLGKFETPLYSLDARIRTQPVRLKFGQLPPMLSALLGMTGARGIIGNELLERFVVIFDPHRLEMQFKAADGD